MSYSGVSTKGEPEVLDTTFEAIPLEPGAHHPDGCSTERFVWAHLRACFAPGLKTGQRVGRFEKGRFLSVET